MSTYKAKQPRKKKKKPTPPFRSIFEEEMAGDLISKGIPVLYETEKMLYVRPETTHKYTPDFILPNGIIIEAKGRLTRFDRIKMVLVRAWNSSQDIRFVFQSPHNPTYKGSKTTYAMWCDKNGFKWAEKFVPQAWIDEKQK
tara:strand:- start:226 stop:648 length:423 start_codon:yes stop_codon:yes gene_type:complete